MKELELQKKLADTPAKPAPAVSNSPTPEKLHSLTTDDLVKLLMSPEISKPANAAVRLQIIRLLQEREGNAFVQRLLGREAGRMSK